MDGAKTLKDARRRLGLKQREMAEILGVGTRHVAGIEGGEYNLTKKLLGKLKTLLPAEVIAEKEDEVYLLNTYRNLSDTNKATLISVVKGLALTEDQASE